MAITIRQMRAAVAVARNGSFGGAAAALHISQPALTVQMRELEQDLGLRLFDRGARGAEPTRIGGEVVETFARLLRELDTVLAGARETASRRAGLVRLAVLPSIGTTLLPATLTELRRTSPGIRVQVHDAVAGRIQRLVRDGVVELGICPDIDPDPSLVTAPLFADALVAVLPRRHALARRAGVTLAALVAEPLILTDPESSVRALFDRACAARGIAVSAAYEATYISTVLALVRAGLGVGVLPASSVEAGGDPGLVARPVTDADLGRRIVLVRRAGRSISPAAEAFVEALAAAASPGPARVRPRP
jgi:LysR family carnitine catabolism transcriptional activator